MTLTATDIDGGKTDLDTLRDVINGAADRINPGQQLGTVTTRDGRVIKTIAKVIDDLYRTDVGGAVASSFAARLSDLEPRVALLGRYQVAQTIGRTVDPVSGNIISSGNVFVWNQPAAQAGQLTQIKIYARSTGTLQIRKYSKSGSTLTLTGSASVVIASIGLKTLTESDFGTFNIELGEYIGLSASNLWSAGPGNSDNGGWWEINDLSSRTVGSPNTTTILMAGFQISANVQDVTADIINQMNDDIEALGTLPARADLVDIAINRLKGTITETIGRPVDPSSGNPVSNQHFIFANPVTGDGFLTTLKIAIAAAGDLTLVRWEKTGDVEFTRRDVRTITATSTGFKTYTPDDFGGPMAFNDGDYVGLSGVGRWYAGPGPADGLGWWGVFDGLDVRTVTNPPITTARLEAQFNFTENAQVVNATAFIALQQAVQSIINITNEVRNDTTVSMRDWTAPEAATNKAPLFGGRQGQRYPRIKNKKVLAHLATVADVAGSVGGIVDEATIDALYGATELRLTTTALSQVVIGPANVNAVTTDVRNGSIAFWFRPVNNVYNGLRDRFGIELHSAGTPTSPTSNYHQLPPTQMGFDLCQRLTSDAGLGRWQRYSAAIQQFQSVGTGADLSAIKFARLVFRSPSGVSMTIALGNIEFLPNPLTKAKAIIGFDDDWLGQNNVVAVAMAKYGFPGVLYPSPIAGRVGVNDALYISPSQIRNLHDNHGWQIASQAWATEDSTIIDNMTEAQRTAEYGKLRAWHRAMGVTGGEHGSYFSNVSQKDMGAYPTFRKHFRSMRCFMNGNDATPPFPVGETFPFGDPMLIRCLNFGYLSNTNITQRLQEHAEQAITNKGVAFFAGHDDASVPGNIQSAMLNLLAFLDANRATIEVCTEEDLLDYL